jgi:hypothetical protein
LRTNAEIQLIVFTQQYWLRFAKTPDNILKIVLIFSAPFDNFADGAIPPSDSSGFVAVQLDEVRKNSAHCLGRALWLLRGHRRQGIDGKFRASLPQRCPEVPLHDPSDLILGGLEEFRDIESSKCGHAFDQGGFDAPHAGKFELRLCGVAGELDFEFMLGVARDLTGERFHLAVELCA